MVNEISIRPALQSDENDIWHIIEKAIKPGDTYVFAPDSSKQKMINYWLSKTKHTYVAEYQNSVVGTFFITDNQPDLGSHVANAGYIVHPEVRGLGIGKRMGQFSISEAKRLGYLAIQFNFVIKTNTPAITLWKKLGFRIIGEIPHAYQHQQLGLTNAYILYREL